MLIDDDQTIYVADTGNHHIMEWKRNAINGQLIVGGNGQGNRTDQLKMQKKELLLLVVKVEERV
jgi:hypothetical protein